MKLTYSFILQVGHKSSEMGCSDEVLGFVVACEGAFVRKEFMSFVHSTECHVAIKFKLSY